MGASHDNLLVGVQQYDPFIDGQSRPLARLLLFGRFSRHAFLHQVFDPAWRILIFMRFIAEDEAQPFRLILLEITPVAMFGIVVLQPADKVRDPFLLARLNIIDKATFEGPAHEHGHAEHHKAGYDQ